MEFEIRKLQLNNGDVPYDDWFNSIRDMRTQAVITARIARLRAGNFGDSKSVGEGVFELRIHFGPGLRVYLGRQGKQLIILLGGGDKSTQAKDIKQAQRFWKEFKGEDN